MLPVCLQNKLGYLPRLYLPALLVTNGGRPQLDARLHRRDTSNTAFRHCRDRSKTRIATKYVGIGTQNARLHNCFPPRKSQQEKTRDRSAGGGALVSHPHTNMPNRKQTKSAGTTHNISIHYLPTPRHITPELRGNLHFIISARRQDQLAKITKP